MGAESEPLGVSETACGLEMSFTDTIAMFSADEVTFGVSTDKSVLG
jgi:hypothetical protein